MAQRPDEIIRKYRAVANLPDFLFAFTFPLRRQAVARLGLAPGDRVLDMGCGSGANFPYLTAAVGPTGEVIGVDLSPDMAAAARRRVTRAGWRNVTVIEGAAETVALPGPFDGLLLFAMHDVLTSALALDRSLAALKPGARVVSAGPKLATHGAGRLLNGLVRRVYGRFAVSRQDMDRPWRLLGERIADLQVAEHGPGLLYVAWGTAR
jgi:ubiquinone/menaquinone biosynthesis C-methylase UbiE